MSEISCGTADADTGDTSGADEGIDAGVDDIDCGDTPDEDTPDDEVVDGEVVDSEGDPDDEIVIDGEDTTETREAGTEVEKYDPNLIIDAELVGPDEEKQDTPRDTSNDGARPGGGPHTPPADRGTAGSGKGGGTARKGWFRKRDRRGSSGGGGTGGGGGDFVVFKREVHKTTNVGSNNALVRTGSVASNNTGTAGGYIQGTGSNRRRPKAGKRR